MVTLVYTTHSSVTLREFQEHSQKSLKMVKIRCKPTLKGPVFLKHLREMRKNSEFREQFQKSHYVRHAANSHFYKSKWTMVICDVHIIKVN